MSVVRPELRAAIHRWREVLIGLAVALAGLWVWSLGGYFYAGLGIVIALTGLALSYTGWRRLRFHGAGEAPGVVEVMEGQITYLAPEGGGFAAITEITAIALDFTLSGQPRWRIAQAGGPDLAIPAAAEGTEALFDAFVSLPGADPARFMAALKRRPAEGGLTVWRRRRDAPALT